MVTIKELKEFIEDYKDDTEIDFQVDMLQYMEDFEFDRFKIDIDTGKPTICLNRYTDN